MPHISFIHGIANKPRADVLLRQWRAALADAGLNLATRGVSSSMVYWADVMYAAPKPADAGFESNDNEVERELYAEDIDDDVDWLQDLPPRQQELLDELSSRFGFDFATPIESHDPASGDFEVFDAPTFLVKRVLRIVARDTHHYLFNVSHTPRPGETFAVKDHVRRLFVDRVREDSLANAGGKHIVVSHSMGTVIAYDCMKNVSDCPAVDGLITFGSPLGVSEIQDEFEPEHNRRSAYPSSSINDGWVNVYDRLDPVALDARIKSDFRVDNQKVISDVKVFNSGLWKHSSEKYLGQQAMVDTVIRLLDL